MNYVVISKENKTEYHMSSHVGKNVLISFAQAPIWKAFYWINVQNDLIPTWYDEETANYALKKYANSKDYEVRPYDEVLKEYKQFIKDNIRKNK